MLFTISIEKQRMNKHWVRVSNNVWRNRAFACMSIHFFSRRDNCTYIFCVECLRVCACMHVYACLFVAAYVSKYVYIEIHMYVFGWYVERHLIEIFQLTQIFISLNSTENIFMFHFESELNGTTKKGTDDTRRAYSTVEAQGIAYVWYMYGIFIRRNANQNVHAQFGRARY